MKSFAIPTPNKLSLRLLLLLLLFSSAKVFAQTDYTTSVKPSLLNCSSSTRCTSKDLSVQDAYVDVGKCFTCTPGVDVTADLWMVINNTTGSIRTSFSLYGTLSTGASINGISKNIFICVGPISLTKALNKFKVGQITFKCGQDLKLTNNYLAWTDASGTTSDRCDTYSNATSCNDIAPKCGMAAEIIIRTPLAATASTAKQPCIGTATGSITVDPSGGTAPYSITIAKKTGTTCSTTPVTADVVATLTSTNGEAVTTSETLAAGDYCIYVTDNTPENATCPPYLLGHTLVGKNCCINPAKPIPISSAANICQSTVNLTICNAVKDVTYYVKQGTTTYHQKATSNGSLIFASPTYTLAPGGGFTCYGIDEVNSGCTAGPSAGCDDIVATCPTSPAIARQGTTTVQEITLNSEPHTSVIAAPNPFNDHIRFTLKSSVSGQGSLELYNTLGQRVKTVFRGNVVAGQAQNIEYAVPGAQRSNLIYVFRVGNEKTSGKLIGLKQ